jgi:hypothetical protein
MRILQLLPILTAMCPLPALGDVFLINDFFNTITVTAGPRFSATTCPPLGGAACVDISVAAPAGSVFEADTLGTPFPSFFEQAAEVCTAMQTTQLTCPVNDELEPVTSSSTMDNLQFFTGLQNLVTCEFSGCNGLADGSVQIADTITWINTTTMTESTDIIEIAATPAPEPGSLVLLASLITLIGFRFRKSRPQRPSAQ